MKTQISFSLETELTTTAGEVLTLAPDEVLEIEGMQNAGNDIWDFYLGNFVCIYGVPGNFSIKE